MSGIIIPSDRTTKQQSRGYCMNPECLESSEDKRFEFDVDNDKFACPKCSQNTPPGVGLLVLTHLLIADPKGPIMGKLQRFSLACNQKRAYLATITNLEAATGDPMIANCPGCLAEAGRRKIKEPQGHPVTPQGPKHPQGPKGDKS